LQSMLQPLLRPESLTQKSRYSCGTHAPLIEFYCSAIRMYLIFCWKLPRFCFSPNRKSSFRQERWTKKRICEELAVDGNRNKTTGAGTTTTGTGTTTSGAGTTTSLPLEQERRPREQELELLLLMLKRRLRPQEPRQLEGRPQEQEPRQLDPEAPLPLEPKRRPRSSNDFHGAASRY
jgi:hypothetical protein